MEREHRIIMFAGLETSKAITVAEPVAIITVDTHHVVFLWIPAAAVRHQVEANQHQGCAIRQEAPLQTPTAKRSLTLTSCTSLDSFRAHISLLSRCRFFTPEPWTTRTSVDQSSNRTLWIHLRKCLHGGGPYMFASFHTRRPVSSRIGEACLREAYIHSSIKYLQPNLYLYPFFVSRLTFIYILHTCTIYLSQHMFSQTCNIFQAHSSFLHPSFVAITAAAL